MVGGSSARPLISARTAEQLAPPSFTERDGGRLAWPRMLATRRSKYIPLPIPAFLVEHPTAGPLTVVGGAGAQFTVLDQLGRPVQRARLSRDLPQLDVRSLPSGQYFLQDEATGQRTRFAKAD